MTDPPSIRADTNVSSDLFDKYVLPKVALTVILIASLIGTWTTGQLGHQRIIVTIAKWPYIVSLGVLTGGFVWKHLFVRPHDLGTDAREYCSQMYARFDKVATGAVLVLLLSGPVVLVGYASALGTSPFVIGFGALFAMWIGTVVTTTRSSAPVSEQFRRPAGLLALVLAVVVVIITALAEVSLRSLEPVAAIIRVLHLLAFAAWVGGAVWNIFVAVPTGQKHPTTAVAQAAGEQLERFRWAVRIIIPTLFATGFYQAVDALGLHLGNYLHGLVGVAVFAKIGLIGMLVVIFKLCPMWRACSPIDGVCDLDDLGTEPPADEPVEGSADE